MISQAFAGRKQRFRVVACVLTSEKIHAQRDESPELHAHSDGLGFLLAGRELTIESGGGLSKKQDVFVIFKVPENWGEAKEIGGGAQAEEKGLFRDKRKFRMALEMRSLAVGIHFG